MKKVLTLSTAFSCLLLISFPSFSQVCTPVAVATCPGATTTFSANASDFSGDFTYVSSGDGFLRSSTNGAGTTKTLVTATYTAPATGNPINARFDLSGTNATITSITISARTSTGDIELCSGGTPSGGVNCYSLTTPAELAGRSFRLVFSFTVVGGNPANRVIEFDDFGINVGAASAPLPVKFANVQAVKVGQQVVISFSNLTEKNVSSYSIERSSNGTSFTSIISIGAVKNHEGQASYTFTDAAPLAESNVYRIKCTEINGKVTYSMIIKVSMTSKGLSLMIAPNPSTGTALGLQVSNLPAGKYTLSIFNAHGQAVGSEVLQHTGGSVSRSVALNNLQSGVYYFELSGSVKLRKQFVVR